MLIKKTLIYVLLLHILFWLTILATPFYIGYAKSFGDIFIKYYIFIYIIIIGTYYFNYFVLIPSFLLKKQRLSYFITLSTLIFIDGVFIVYFDVYDYNFSFQNVIKSVYNLISTNQLLTILSHKRFYIIITIIILFIGFGTNVRLVTHWLTRERRKITKEKLSAELSYLKSQIDPHFFFNTLNNIYSLAQLKSDKAPQTILKLSELMRYNIYEADKNLVYLKDEINYIQNFIDLQRIRLAKNVDIDFYVIGNIGNKKIEPLLFLPFIENAFKHGIDYANNCTIDIEISIEEKEITLLVINNTTTRKEKISKQSGVGLSNIKKRLELLYKDKYDLSINENEKSFMVKLNLQLNEY